MAKTSFRLVRRRPTGRGKPSVSSIVEEKARDATHAPAPGRFGPADGERSGDPSTVLSYQVW